MKGKFLLSYFAGLAALFALPQASAYVECGFDRAPGALVRFIPQDSNARFHNRTTNGSADVYGDWLTDLDRGQYLDVRTYFARFAKLEATAVRTVNERDPIARTTYRVRYYPALVENCDRVYLRIAENDPRLEGRLMAGGTVQQDQIPIAQVGHVFGVRFENSVRYFAGLEGETLRVAAPGKVPFQPKQQAKARTLPAWSEVTMIDVNDRPFIHEHRTLAAFSLEVKLSDGTVGYIPGTLHQLHERTVLSRYDTETQDTIRAGLLKPGMTSDQVYLAWGEATTIRHFPVVKHANGGIETLYGDKPGPVESSEVIGIESHWFYPSRLGENPLVFNVDNVLERGAPVRAGESQ